MSEKIVGSWKLKNSENFDELMTEMGIGWMTRKAANIAKPVVSFKLDGNVLTIKSESTLKTTEHSVTLTGNDEETAPMDVNRPDGVQIKARYKFVNGHLTETQEHKDYKTVVVERWVDDDDTLQVKSTCGKIVCNRTYQRA